MGIWRRIVFRYAAPGVQLRPSQIFAFFLVLALESLLLRYGFGIWRIEKTCAFLHGCRTYRHGRRQTLVVTEAVLLAGLGSAVWGGNHGGVFNTAVCAGADGSGNPDGKDSACGEIAER